MKPTRRQFIGGVAAATALPAMPALPAKPAPVTPEFYSPNHTPVNTYVGKQIPVVARLRLCEDVYLARQLYDKKLTHVGMSADRTVFELVYVSSYQDALWVLYEFGEQEADRLSFLWKVEGRLLGEGRFYTKKRHIRSHVFHDPYSTKHADLLVYMEDDGDFYHDKPVVKLRDERYHMETWNEIELPFSRPNPRSKAR